jgi:hypothetical protein
MKYAVEMGSGAVIYVPTFIKIGSSIQKLIGGIHRQHGDRISLFYFFENKYAKNRVGWFHLAQAIVQSGAFVNTVMNLRVP